MKRFRFSTVLESLSQGNDFLFGYRRADGVSQSYERALDILTRGFVRAQTSYTWVPEMLYLIGDCYLRSDEVEAAQCVDRNINFVSDSVWAPVLMLAELPSEAVQ